ncbi:MAG: hypothetical protein H7A46_26075 [Verrucomicrobiales bacterium]|nr:hypothetical protein [Verrucomicrobiales bacterium]
MNLRDVQTNVKTLLQAHPGLALAPIVLDDGAGEANPQRTAALKSLGFCLLVWRVEGGGMIDVSRTGAFVQELTVFVFIEEAVPVCRKEGGLNLRHEDATEYVMAALSGARVGPDRFTLDNPPFDNLGRINGVNRVLVNALAQLTIAPLSS